MVRADDNEPLTEEWLRSAGFVDRGDGYTLVLREQDGDGNWHSLECADTPNLPGCPWELWNLTSEQTQEAGVMLPILPETRDDVRNLADALWMTLKE